MGATQQFVVSGTYSDGTSKTVSDGVTWSSSDETIATVTAVGQAKGAAAGTATITAKVGNLSGKATLTVKAKALTSLQVTPPAPTIAFGTTQQFTATANYDDGTTADVSATATWASSDTAIATINTSGLATAVKAGTSTITAEYNGQTGTAVLTVSPAKMTGIVVDPGTASIAAGATQAFKASAKFEDNSTQDVTSQVTWSSSDTAIATIAADGTAKGVAAGDATITAKLGTLSGTATLTVTAATLSDLVVTPALGQGHAGGAGVQFTATATYSDNTTADVSAQASWSSSADTIATIDTAGMATPVAAGTATITADFSGLTATATFIVDQAVVVSIQVEPATKTIAKGTTVQYTATATYSDSSTQNVTSSATWQSSAAGVATIDATGLATGAGPGDATITATFNGQSATAALTVTAATLSSIQVTPLAPSIALGATQQFTATGTYTDSSTQDLTTQASWASSDTTVATISAAGLATSVAAGSTQITATFQGITSNTAVLAVTTATVKMVTVTPATPSIAKGTTQQFTATATYTDNSQMNVTSSASWTSSDTGTATIDPTGLATGVAAGSATITATFNGQSGTATLTVSNPTLTSIQVEPATASIAKGTTQQYVATAHFSDNTTQDVSATASWTSSNTAAATISATGLATSVAAGTTTITATYNSVTSNSATLVVTAATVTSLAVSPATPSIAKGTTQQFTATATYTDGSTQNVTSSATWTSGTPATATISATGLATSVAAGTSTITAAFGGQSGTATLTVTAAVVTSVQVDPPTATIAKGQTQAFTATAIFSDGTNQAVTTGVTWASGTPATATISGAGVASGIAAGTTNITATYNTIASAPAVLTVTNAVPTSLAITPATASIANGTTQQFSATVTLSDSTQQNVTSAASWSSSNTGVATINSAGLATSVTAGTANIQASYMGVNATPAVLTVTPATLVSITITASDLSISKGTTTTLTAMGSYTDGTSQNISSTVTWKQTPAGILTFAANVATGTTVGSTAVTATSGTITSNTVSIHVTNAVLTKIDITPVGPLSLAEGTPQQFIATGTYSDNSTQVITTDAATTWQSSEPTKLSISNTAGSRGLATALVPGNAVVTATQGTIVSNQVNVTVTTAATLSYIVLTPPTWSTNVSTTTTFTAVAWYADGTSAPLNDGTWTVEDSTGTVVTNVTLGAASNPNQRLATAATSTAALAGGKAYVRVRKGSVEAKSDVTVKDTNITSIAVTCPQRTCLPTPASVVAGSYNGNFTVDCSALATYSDSTTADVTETATWTTTDPTVASASSNGHVSINAAGTATVQAQVGTVQSAATGVPNATLTAVDETFTGLTVTPSSLLLNSGKQQQLTASAGFTGTGTCSGSRSFDVTHQSKWDTFNTSVAQVSGGLVTAGIAGTTTVWAGYANAMTTVAVVVNSACIESVSIANVGLSNVVPTNVVVPLQVGAHYSDGTNQTVTAGSVGSWSSTSVNPSTWNLSVGTTDPGKLTYSLSTGTCAGATVSASTTITVSNAAALTSVAVTPGTPVTIAKGGYADYLATASYSGGYGTYDVSPYATWSNSPAITGLTNAASPVATPSQRFSHSGTATGTTNVLAVYKSQSSNLAALTITGAVPTAVSVTGTVPTIPAQGVPGGLKLTYSASVTYSDGTVVANPPCLSWSSSDATYLAFTGKVADTYTKADAKTVTVTATCTEGAVTKTGTQSTLVNTATLADITFTPASPMTLPRSTTAPLTVTGVYSNGTSFDIGALTTIAVQSGASSASIVSGAVVVQAAPNADTSIIRFSKGTLYRDYTVVVSATSCIDSVAFTTPAADPVSLSVGQTADYTATAHYTTGGTANVTATGTWSPDNTYLDNLGNFSVAGSAINRYQALAVGNSKVSFTISGASVCAGGNTTATSITIDRTTNVDAATISSIQIRPQPVSGQTRRRIPAGQHLQLTLIPIYTDGHEGADVASSAVWTIVNTGTAAPEVGANTGLLYAGTSYGVDDVRADYLGLTATLGIDVQNCGAPTVAVTTAGSGKLPVGQTRDYTASATYATSGTCTGDTTERQFDVTKYATWASSNAVVASIQTTGGANPGRALGSTAGSANIQAIYNGTTANAANNPLQVVAVSLKLLATSAPASTFVGPGGAVTVTVSAVWTDGTTDFNLTPPASVTWIIVDPTVISITATADPTKYTLVGLKAGTSQYRAQSGTILSTPASIDVTAACINAVKLQSAPFVFPVGAPFDLTALCEKSDALGTWNPCTAVAFSNTGSVIEDVFSTFVTKGNGRIATNATVGAVGTVTATVSVANGACVSSKTDTQNVTVGSATLSSMTVAGPATMAKGTKAIFTATGAYTGGTGANNYDLTPIATYTSSNTSVATADNDGTGHISSTLVEGTTYVSAFYLGVTSNLLPVQVTNKVETQLAISADPNLVGGPTTSASIPNSWALQLHSKVTYSDNSFDNDLGTVTWSKDVADTSNFALNNAGLVTVDASTTNGAHVVHAAFNALAANFTVNVMSGSVLSIAIVAPDGSAAATLVPKGLTQDYAAQVTINNATGPTYWGTRDVGWYSDAASVATIAQSGAGPATLTAQGLGTAHVTAIIGAVIGNLTVTVGAATPQYIWCAPSDVPLSVGDKAQLRAYLHNSDNTNTEVTSATATSWTSADATIADFLAADLQGVVTGLKAGAVKAIPATTVNSTTFTADASHQCTINVN